MTSSTDRIERASIAALVAALALVWPATPAHAQASPTAEALFDEGKRLMAEGKVDEACVALEKSYAMIPLGGTLLGVAICHEKQGRLVVALREYETALELATRGDRPDRAEHARRAIDSLRARIPNLTVDVPADAKGLAIDVDGAPWPRDKWNRAQPIDPGAHRIAWRGDGIESGSRDVTVREGERARVAIAPGRAPSAAAVAPSEPPPAPESAEADPLQIAAFATGATGLAALGTGAVFGLLALDRSSTADAGCDDGSPPACTREGLDAFESGRDMALAADILLGAGLVLSAVSVTLFVWPSDDGETVAWVGVGGAPRTAVSAGGTF